MTPKYLCMRSIKGLGVLGTHMSIEVVVSSYRTPCLVEYYFIFIAKNVFILDSCVVSSTDLFY